MEMLSCSRCAALYERPAHLSSSLFSQNPFVCSNCRCKSCSIVLNIECECGERHGDSSESDPQLCVECEIIQVRVSKLDNESAELRLESYIEEIPIYDVEFVPMIDPDHRNGCPNDD